MINLKNINFDGKKGRFSIAFLLVAALSACVAPQPVAPVKPVNFPEEVVRSGLTYSFANEIATRCSREFRLNRQTFEAETGRLTNKYPELNGLSKAQIDAAILSGPVGYRVQDEMIAYVSKRKILVTDTATWCAAGRYEKANKTAIGAYLTPR